MHAYNTPALYGAVAFCCLLSAYFVLLPLREEAGIALGAQALPSLFACSLVATLVASPAASAIISSTHQGRGGHQRVLHTFAGWLVVLYAAFSLVGPELPSVALDKGAHGQSGALVHGTDAVRTPSALHAHQPYSTRSATLHHKMAAMYTRAMELTHGPHLPFHESADAMRDQQGHAAPATSKSNNASNAGTGAGSGMRAQAHTSAAATRRMLSASFNSLSHALSSAHTLQHSKSIRLEQSGDDEVGRLQLGGDALQHIAQQQQQGRPLPTAVEHQRGAPSSRISALHATALAAHAAASGNADDRPTPARTLHMANAVLHATLYVTVSVMSVVGASTLWALCSITFPPTAAKSCYGLLSAGATTGQLLGSATSLAITHALAAWLPHHGPPTALLCLSAGLHAGAAHCMTRMTAAADAVNTEGGCGPHVMLLPDLLLSSDTKSLPSGSLPAAARSMNGSGTIPAATLPRADDEGLVQAEGTYLRHRELRDSAPTAASSHDTLWAAASSTAVTAPTKLAGVKHGTHNDSPDDKYKHKHVDLPPIGHAVGGMLLPLSHGRGRRALVTQLRGMWASVVCVVRSPYLLTVCTFMAITSMSSSMMYFERQVVVARSLHDATSRLSLIAKLNGASGAAILLLQLTTTSRVIKMLGVRVCLGAAPVMSILAFGVCTCFNAPATVAGMEVMRKVVGYSVGRPTRELLFTPLPREQVAAKVVVDGVVGRAGDALAAAIFQVLGVWLQQGPRAVAAAGGVLSCLWLFVAGLAATRFQALATSCDDVR